MLVTLNMGNTDTISVLFQVYSMFNDVLNNVKKELSYKSTNLMPQHPKYAGAAHWARGLKRRIDRPMEVNCGIRNNCKSPSFSI